MRLGPLGVKLVEAAAPGARFVVSARKPGAVHIVESGAVSRRPNREDVPICGVSIAESYTVIPSAQSVLCINCETALNRLRATPREAST